MKTASWRNDRSDPSNVAPQSADTWGPFGDIVLRIGALLIFLLGAAVLVLGQDTADSRGKPQQQIHRPRLASHAVADELVYMESIDADSPMLD